MSKTIEEQISGFLCNAQENIKAAYLKGYNNGLSDGNINKGTFAAKVNAAYNNGLNDAWKCAKKIATSDGLKPNELETIFDHRGIDPIFEYFSASEAMAKIKEYEEKKAERNASPDNELHIGDEVYALDENERKTVTAIKGVIATVLCSSGKYGEFNISDLHKTGRRFAIDEILRELKGE